MFTNTNSVYSKVVAGKASDVESWRNPKLISLKWKPDKFIVLLNRIGGLMILCVLEFILGFKVYCHLFCRDASQPCHENIKGREPVCGCPVDVGARTGN